MSSSTRSQKNNATPLSQSLKEQFHPEALKQVLAKRNRVKPTLRDLMITDERGRLVPLHLNYVQCEIMAELGFDPDDPSPQIGDKEIRLLYLKARRQGVSTFLSGLVFLDTYNNENRRSMVLAQDIDATKTIFEIARRYYDKLPQHMKIPI